MSLFKSIFGQNNTPVTTNQEFWNWFILNEATFFKVVKNGDDIERKFFGKLSPKLHELKDGFFFLAGMSDDNTAELILTADGIIKNIAFVEELINAAPILSNWKFTALKPAMNADDLVIKMNGFVFESEKLSFYSNDNENYPDVIDVVLVHSDLSAENEDVISNGSFIFLDNMLGELNFASNIDNISVEGPYNAKKELIPISKLKDFLIWREKEFLEKYEGKKYNTENDGYSALEGTIINGKPTIAIVNKALLEWDCKASHPWILSICINYKGDSNGMPTIEAMTQMNGFEDLLLSELKDSEGYLYFGRETVDGEREIFMACKEFRKPSKILHELIVNKSNDLSITYEIYKDKYWQTFEKFMPN